MPTPDARRSERAPTSARPEGPEYGDGGPSVFTVLYFWVWVMMGSLTLNAYQNEQGLCTGSIDSNVCSDAYNAIQMAAIAVVALVALLVRRWRGNYGDPKADRDNRALWLLAGFASAVGIWCGLTWWADGMPPLREFKHASALPPDPTRPIPWKDVLYGFLLIATAIGVGLGVVALGYRKARRQFGGS